MYEVIQCTQYYIIRPYRTIAKTIFYVDPINKTTATIHKKTAVI